MKFLCVPCDTPMKLSKAAPPERGSLAVEYECPECFHTMAMLTNPMETQMVTSLGVKIGPGGGGAPAAGSASPDRSTESDSAAVGAPSAHGGSPAGASAEGSGCPFSGVVEEMAAGQADSGGLTWTPTAQERLQNIPSFVRAMARKGIDKYAREKGLTQVDDALLDEAKDFFGM